MVNGKQNIKDTLTQIAEFNNNRIKEKIKKCCEQKINQILSKEDLTNDDINALNNLYSLYCKCCEDATNITIDNRAVNTKEEGEQLKGLVMGNYNFEDWHIMRILLKIKMIESLLGGK